MNKVFAFREIDSGAFESKLVYKGNSIFKMIKHIIILKLEKIYCIKIEWY